MRWKFVRNRSRRGRRRRIVWPGLASGKAERDESGQDCHAAGRADVFEARSMHGIATDSIRVRSFLTLYYRTEWEVTKIQTRVT